MIIFGLFHFGNYFKNKEKNLSTCPYSKQNFVLFQFLASHRHLHIFSAVFVQQDGCLWPQKFFYITNHRMNENFNLSLFHRISSPPLHVYGGSEGCQTVSGTCHNLRQVSHTTIISCLIFQQFLGWHVIQTRKIF